MPDAAVLTIGEVAREAGVNTSAIRYYERVGILPAPDRRSAATTTHACIRLGQQDVRHGGAMGARRARRVRVRVVQTGGTSARDVGA